MKQRQFNPYENQQPCNAKRRRLLTSQRNKLVQEMLSGEGSVIHKEQLTISLSVVNVELRAK